MRGRWRRSIAVVASEECPTWTWAEGTASCYLGRRFPLAEPPGPELEGSARITGAPVRKELVSVAVPARSQRALLHVKTRGRKRHCPLLNIPKSNTTASRTFFYRVAWIPHTTV